MPEIRALESTKRPMQRLGYLKRIVRRVTTLSSTNMENLGRDLIDNVTRKARVPLSPELAEYVKLRLYDRAYASLKAQVSSWQKQENTMETPIVLMELQDLYLAAPGMPSRVGKLTKTEWESYPVLGVCLGLVRGGTFSANTRALSLLHFVSDAEQQAFLDYKPDANPLQITRQQALLFLYALIENDGEVIAPLFVQLAEALPNKFSDRDAGDRLPDIYRAIATRHRARSLPAQQRDRLLTLEKTANSIAKRADVERYVGSSREHASRVRVEPYADIGLLTKPNPFKYEFAFSSAGLSWANAFQTIETSEQVEEFLARKFFSTAAIAWNIEARKITTHDEIVPFLQSAWHAVHSPGGYAPIEEMAIVAGIHALLEQKLIIEPGDARDAIIAYQKTNPYQVRFTVNRMGVLAHARFLEAPAQPNSQVADGQPT